MSHTDPTIDAERDEVSSPSTTEDRQRAAMLAVLAEERSAPIGFVRPPLADRS